VGEANRVRPDEQRLLDALVQDGIGAWTAPKRGRRWDAVAAVEQMRMTLLSLCGRRDGLQLDRADPASALEQVIAQTAADFRFGPRGATLLRQIGMAGFLHG
jgi:hypothetical protein